MGARPNPLPNPWLEGGPRRTIPWLLRRPCDDPTVTRLLPWLEGGPFAPENEYLLVFCPYDDRLPYPDEIPGTGAIPELFPTAAMPKLFEFLESNPTG